MHHRSRNILKSFYEFLLASLALVMLGIMAAQFSIRKSGANENILVLNIVSASIVVVFMFDYIVKFIIAQDKKKYFKSHILELLSIIPFLQVLRILRLLRLITFVALFYKKIRAFLVTNNFEVVLFIAIGSIILSAIGVTFTEHISFGTAIWWAFVTIATVGYGDVVPVSPGGRLIGILLMITGVSFLGALTSTMSTYFIKKKTPPPRLRNEVVECIKNRLDDYKNLREEDVDDICILLKTLINK